MTRAFLAGLSRAGVWALLAFSSYWSVRLAWADHLSRSIRLSDRERALALAPAWAPLYDRLACRRMDLGESPLADLSRAAALEPEDPARLERLAQYAELAGDLSIAERSLLAAVSRSRIYQARYLLAQFYFRRRQEPAFWRWSRAAMETAPGDALPLFDLCWRMRPDPLWLARDIVPPRPEMRCQLVTFLIGQHEMRAAGEAALKLAENASPSQRSSLVGFVDAGLAAGSAQPALDIWNALCRRGVLPHPPLEPGRLTNPGLNQYPSGAGFDWRVADIPGVRIGFVPGQLKLTFSGTQPEQCTVLWQYVPVTPGAHFRVRCRGATDGVAWRIEPIGAAGDLVRVSLVYQRPPGSSRLEGTVILSGLMLERAP